LSGNLGGTGLRSEDCLTSYCEEFRNKQSSVGTAPKAVGKIGILSFR